MVPRGGTNLIPVEESRTVMALAGITRPRSHS